MVNHVKACFMSRQKKIVWIFILGVLILWAYLVFFGPQIDYEFIEWVFGVEIPYDN